MSTPISALLTVAEAVEDPRTPWRRAKQLYHFVETCRPTRDSKGNVIDRGDPEMLACFIRLSSAPRAALFVDIERLVKVIGSRRLDAEAA